MSKSIKRSVIITGFSCNCRCRFCMNIDERYFSKTTPEIEREMALSRKYGKTHLSFFGGENSIRPDFIHLVKRAKMLGFEEITTGTNGRMFAYKEFAKKVLQAGLSELYFSIHGHNSKVHDQLTGMPGSFDQLRQGIENIRSFGFKRYGSHTTIVKQNFRFLPEIGDFIIQNGIRSAEFLYVNPSLGGAKKYFNELIPRFSEAAPYIKKCLKKGDDNNIRDWSVSHVPLCLFRGYEARVNQPDMRRTKTGFKPIESLYFANGSNKQNKSVPHVSVQERAQTAKCSLCKLKNKCLGIWKDYVKVFGDGELKPILS